MDVKLFDYELPEHLIAQTPLIDRLGSRLLVFDRQTEAIEHRSIADIIEQFKPGDALVINDTKVMPARLFGSKQDTGAKIEVLLLKQQGEDRWQALVKPAKRVKTGAVLVFGAQHSEDDPLLTATVMAEGEMGLRELQFSYKGIFNVILDQLGQMPLPPYIKERLADQERYQTVYAKVAGSAAAPTAGLHFNEHLLAQIVERGVTIAPVTLHVGLGTFRPVSVEQVEAHEMHAEYVEVPQTTANIINETRADGGRIIAVGTTSVRALETAALRTEDGVIREMAGWTDIFIYPGYEFRLVDALLTNFHLPRSTLLMLVSAFAGRENVMKAYKEAIQQQYRFFSFGDAMFIK